MTRQGARTNSQGRVRRGVAVLAVLCAALWYTHAAWAGPEVEAPAGVDALVLAGSQALYDGNVQEAEQYLRRAVEADPHSVFAMNQLGAALARQKRFTEAGRMFTRVLALDEGNLFALIWRGVLALEAGRPGAARRAFGAVLERDAANPDGCIFWAWCMPRRGTGTARCVILRGRGRRPCVLAATRKRSTAWGWPTGGWA
jgi:tetratricopeptide (TPR) repeat protein